MTDFTPDEAMADALAKHPECSYADWDNGLSIGLGLTIVVSLWRNVDCWMNEDPPRNVVEGYPARRTPPLAIEPNTTATDHNGRRHRPSSWDEDV